MAKAMLSEDFIDAVPMPTVAIGPDARLAGMNAHAKVLLGEGLQGRHYATVFRQPSLVDPLDRALNSGLRQMGRHQIASGAKPQLFDVTITPLKDEQGAILVFQDVSATEQAGEMRSEFVANVSHELRTPLTAISGFIETLMGPAKDDAGAREHFLAIMFKEAGRMHRLVDDLLSLAKVEDMEGYRPTDPQDVSALVSSAVRSLRPVAEDMQVEMRLHLSDAQTPVPGDADQLTQVFTNLIENAIKYGGSGGVVDISVERVEMEPRLRGPAVLVSVADQGDGIDERHLARLTERFYRVDSHRSRGMGGTGLGLAIVKHILNRHRGALRIVSTVGEGSRFTVALPIS